MPINTDLLDIPRSRNLDMDYDANSRRYRAALDELFRLQTGIRLVNAEAVPAKIASGELSAFNTAKGNLLTALTTALGYAKEISALLDND